MRKKGKTLNIIRKYILKLKKIFNVFSGAVFSAFLLSSRKIRLYRMEFMYRLHMRMRSVHDSLYQRSRIYKRVSENPYTVPVKRATYAAFAISLVLFIGFQFLLPNFFNTDRIMAGANSVTWTTSADFSSNAITTGTATSGLGVNMNDNQLKLISDSSLKDVLKVVSSSTSQSTIALKNDGTVWAWGKNTSGQLGDNSTVQRNAPVQVKGVGNVGYLTDIKDVATGGEFSLALKSDGTVFSWGSNVFGQLGNNSVTPSLVPVQVINATNDGILGGITKISAGTSFSLALTSNGTAFSWGRNQYGELGNNSADLISMLPVQAKDSAGTGFLSGISAITTGSNHSSVVKDDGTIWSWGSNGQGQLGQNTADANSHPLPLQVLGTGGSGYLTDISTVAAGQYFNLAIKKTGGTLWGWGQNIDGALGDNSSVSKYAPVQVKDSTGTGFISDVTAVSGTSLASVALKADGSVWAWGLCVTNGRDNTCGWHGLPKEVRNSTNTGPLTGIASIGSGGSHALAVQNNGNVLAWGSNGSGQLGMVGGSSVFPNLVTSDVSYFPKGKVSLYKLVAPTKSIFASLSWNTEALPANTDTKFRVRSAESDASLSSAIWSDYLVQNTLNSTSGSGILTAIAPNKYLEIEVTLDSSVAGNTPTINDFTVSYDSLEAPSNGNITLTKTDDTPLKTSTGTTITGGIPGAYTNGTSVKVTAANLTCVGCGTSTNRRPEVEIKPLGTVFDGVSTTTATGSNNYVTMSGLSSGISYHLRVRTVDDEGRTSDWTNYGNNIDLTDADMAVDGASPNGTLAIEAGSKYVTSTTVTLNLSATDDGGSGVSQMQFSNDGTTWPGWETYAVTKTWTLDSGDGEKTVYGKFRDNAGNERRAYGSGTMTGSPVADWQAISQGDHYGNFYDSISKTWATVDRAGVKTAYDPGTNKIYDVPANKLAIIPRTDGGGGVEAMVESVRTNYLKNSYFNTDSNGDGQADNVTIWVNSLGVVSTISPSSVYGKSQNVAVTNNTGTTALSSVQFWTDPNTFAPTETAIASFYVSGSGFAGATLRPYFVAATGNSSEVVGSVWGSPVTLTNKPTRVSLPYPNLPTGTTHVAIQLHITMPNNTSGTVSFSAAQVEKLSGKDAPVATSYIPTTTAPVTRPWEHVSIPTTNWTSALPGSLLTLVSQNFYNDYYPHTLLQGSSGWGFYLGKMGGHPTNYSPGWLFSLNSAWIQFRGMNPNMDGTGIVGMRWSKNEHGGFAYGYYSPETVSGPRDNTVTATAEIGQMGNNGTWDGPIQRFTYYPSRLSNGAISAVSYSIKNTAANTVLDTIHPESVASLGGYTNVGKDTQLSQSSWYDASTTSPYFEWDANTDSDLGGYKYCFGTSTCTPSTDIGKATNVTLDLANTSDGTYYFRVAAYDLAGNLSETLTSHTFKYDRVIPGNVSTYTATQNDASQIAVTWTAVESGGGSDIHYTLERISNESYINGYAIADSQYKVWSESGSTYKKLETSALSITEKVPVETDPEYNDLNKLQAGTKYVYRIKAYDETGKSGTFQTRELYGLTRDGVAPTSPSNVVASACSYQNLSACSDYDPDTSLAPNDSFKGRQNKLTWSPGTDSGTGIVAYQIYRATTEQTQASSYKLVGTLENVPNPLPQAYQLSWHDSYSTTAYPINDLQTYHYRIVSVDGAATNDVPPIPANTSPIVPGPADFTNYAATMTPDITAPIAPNQIIVSAAGIDSMEQETQKIIINWSEAFDGGSGVSTYKLYRANRVPPDTTDESDSLTPEEFVDITDDPEVSCNMNTRMCVNGGLEESSYYYYQIKAVDDDPYNNESDFSDVGYVKTTTSAVPSPPKGRYISDAYEEQPYIFSTKGDPSTPSSLVGKEITVTFSGSKIKGEIDMDKYEVYRSTTNYQSSIDWKDPTKADKLKLTLTDSSQNGYRYYKTSAGGSTDIPATVKLDDTDNYYVISDTGVSSATKYYYKIRAVGTNELIEFGGESFSLYGVDPNQGWDITPDNTAPNLPGELKVKDIHDDGL
ncbi:MAG: hypothetical protein WCP14_04230, partial [bacterium]